MGDKTHMGPDYIRESINRAQRSCNTLFRIPVDNGVQSIVSARISHHQTHEMTNSTAALMQYVAGPCVFGSIDGQHGGREPPVDTRAH